VQYAAGSENVVADALSRLYSNDDSRTVRARSEYTYFDINDDEVGEVVVTAAPLLAGMQAAVAVTRPPRRGTAVEPAESGRPETAAEFASRMRDHFVLRGPERRKEGESSFAPSPRYYFRFLSSLLLCPWYIDIVDYLALSDLCPMIVIF
jgi:hypothetical protein